VLGEGQDGTPVFAGSDLPDQGSPEVSVSYAWGDKTPDASQKAHQHQEVVERMCETPNGWLESCP
jgi:hypothetical protein